MTLIIDLTPEQEAALRARAAERGQEVAVFVRETLLLEIQPPTTFDEVLAPIREQVAASGMTEDELDELFNEALREVRQERKKASR